MKKIEFLLQLYDKLSALPQEDVEERLAFYDEMINDRMEEGLSEEEAVAQIGNVDEIASQIIQETPLSRLVLEKIKPKKRRKAWEIVLLALGSPVWLSLLIAAFAVVLSLYVVLWVVVICFWSAFASVAACSLGGVAAGIVFACCGHGTSGAIMIAAGLICAGLSVFLFYGCKAATKGTVLLTKKIILGIKRRLVKKEDA